MIDVTGICELEVHERKKSPSQWALLPLIGEMPGYDDSRPTLVLELRNCPCGSTLAKEVER